MINKVKKVWKKRKVKLFFVFLLCSFFAWFVSNLSESYTSNATFDLKFKGIPEDKMLLGASQEKLEVKLEALGFQFFRFNFNNKTVTIDLAKVQKQGERYFIVPNQYQQQIEKQLSSSMRLLQIVEDTIFFDFQEVTTKELPVKPIIEMNFDQNYFLDGVVEVAPPTISITGPANEVNGILELMTLKIELDDLTSDFSKTVFVVKPDSMFNTRFSEDKVSISGKVSKFSEKIIEVPIQVLNLPENMSIRTFPDEIKVLCKAKMSDLKNLSAADFTVIADYQEVDNENTKSNMLSLSLQKVPQSVFRASLLEKRVEYILRKK